MTKQIIIIYQRTTGNLICELITVEGKRLREIYLKTLIHIKNKGHSFNKAHYQIGGKQSEMKSVTPNQLQDEIAALST
jgi:hypothetical protein